VARGYTGQVKHLVELIKGGIQHRGFALIDAFSPCVTFNLENTHDFFKQRTFKLEDKMAGLISTIGNP
jgi:2-oxoglutarate ferredoxin oxidoreductase subunit beta